MPVGVERGVIESHAPCDGWRNPAGGSSTPTPPPRLGRHVGALEKAALAAAEGARVDAAGYDQRPLGAHLTPDDPDSVAHGRGSGTSAWSPARSSTRSRGTLSTPPAGASSGPDRG